MIFYEGDPNIIKGHVILLVNNLKDKTYIILATAEDTTKNALTIAAYNIILDNTIYYTLTAELKEVFPGPNIRLDFVLLKRLPYLVRLLPSNHSYPF
jgi:hypothetical protein